MASDGETDKLDDSNTSISHDDSTTASEQEEQDESTTASEEEEQDENKDGGPADTRNKKNGKKQSSEDDPKKEKRMNMKRRLDNGMENDVTSDDDNEGDLDNESSHKSKKYKKNPTKTVSAPAEPTPQPLVVSGSNSLPTSTQVCTSFGLNDVQILYGELDYQKLKTFKSFTQHVRPILAKENPKVLASNLMMLVAAKWREFSCQKPIIEQIPPPPLPPPAANTKKKVMPTVQEVCTAFSLKDVEIKYNEVDDDVDLKRYISFSSYVRPILAKENPKAANGKIMMLAAAKWREFSREDPNLTEQTPPSPPPAAAADPEKEEMVTVESVCASFGLNDVEIEYNGVENLTNYKSFTQCVRPILSKANPKVPIVKIMVLVKAKWEEFCRQKSALPDQRPPPATAVVEKKRMPSVQEVCSSSGLKDVKIQYREIGYENLRNYKSFFHHVRLILIRENPKAHGSKIMKLVAAKWREFSSQHCSTELTDSGQNKENEVQGVTSKPTQSGISKPKVFHVSCK